MSTPRDSQGPARDAAGDTPLYHALGLVRNFYGNSTKELELFLRSYELAARQIPDNTQFDLLEGVISTKMKGKAEADLNFRNVTNFATLKSTLSSMFAKKRSRGSVEAELQTCRQGRNESVQSFATRLQELETELSELVVTPQFSDEVNAAYVESVRTRALDAFYNGLRGEVRTIIRSKSFGNLSEAIAVALEEQAAIDSNIALDREIPYNRTTIQCERCNRLGHSTRNCYARSSTPRIETSSRPPQIPREVQPTTATCQYCKNPGHSIRDCRARQRAGDRNQTSTRESTSRTVAAATAETENANPDSANEDTYDETNPEETVKSFRIHLVASSALKNVIEIKAPELANGKANMLVDTGAEITLMKIGKLLENIKAKREQVSLRGIAAIEIKTLCLVQLNIRVGNEHITHPCRLVPDDFPIETDGILGHDFMTKHNVCIKINEFLDIYGTKFPLLNNDYVTLKPRTENIILAKTQNIGEGIAVGQIIKPGVYMGNALTIGKEGRCLISIMNTTTDEALVDIPTVKLETCATNDTDLPCNDVDRQLGFAVRFLTGKDRMQTLRENLRTDHLNNEEKASLMEVCEKYNDIFQLEGDKLGYTTKLEHSIPLIQDTKPINVKPYRLPQTHKEEVNRQIKEMLDEGIIRPSTSQWNAPLLVVKKKPDASGKPKLRIVIDFRKLNDITIGDSYPLPNITDILDQLGGASYFSTLDLASGFHQIALSEPDREKTAFSTPYGHYEYNRMPFGLKNAPATFQRAINTAMVGLQGLKCFVYVDDIVVYGRTLKEHQERLALIFERIRETGLKLQPNKCEFLRKETVYLGHIITENGIKPDPSKLNAVQNFPIPKKGKDVQSFLGLAGYYRKFIENFSKITKPLTQLLKKNQEFRWTDQEQEAFDILKEKLTTAPILKYPDFSKPFILTTDASGKAIGAILSQGKIGQDLPVAYASRILNKAEINYSTIEKELLAIVWATQHFRPYLYGTKFTIVTDHKPLTWLFNVKDPGSRLMRWKLKLAEYDYSIEYKDGKTNKNADALSRMFLTRKRIGTDEVGYRDETETLEDDSDNDEYTRNENQDEQTDNKTYTEDEKKRILFEYHDTPLGGHLGVKRTLERTKLNHTWPGMRKDIENYIAKCEKCQKNKLSKVTKTPMVITDTPTEPFEKCALDIVGPLPETSKGNKYILTFQDLLTKFSKAIPIENQEANTVAKEFVTKIICEYGIPERILTDQGTNFLSQIFKNVCKLLKIDKIQTTSYHPQSNGALERSHRTLAEYLKNFISEDQTDWD